MTRLQGNKAVLHSRLGQKSSSMDSGASEALHTAQDSSEAAGTEDRMRCLQEEVARLQHDKSLMQNHLEDMGSELKAAEARAERLEAAQENAKLPCFPVHLLSLWIPSGWGPVMIGHAGEDSTSGSARLECSPYKPTLRPPPPHMEMRGRATEFNLLNMIVRCIRADRRMTCHLSGT